MAKWLTLSAAALLATSLSSVALAQGGMDMTQMTQKEVGTAQAHAIMAQGAQNLKMSHTHLHHVINCLVGPEGSAFDANAANPCAKLGNGALPDSKGNEALHNRLDKALAAAQEGLKTTELKASQADAAKVADILKTD